LNTNNATIIKYVLAGCMYAVPVGTKLHIVDKVGGGGSLKRSISCFLFKRSQEKMKDSPNNY
jgi:hypothetical protein